MTLEQQRDVLDKTHKLLTDFCGKPPRGSVAPWWETSHEGVELMMSYGIEYDHSMSHDDGKSDFGKFLPLVLNFSSLINLQPTCTGCGLATLGQKSTTRRKPKPG
jgi:peptidoglycan/xylan/chitin deacetylase (PgdA/CDA1 family)